MDKNEKRTTILSVLGVVLVCIIFIAVCIFVVKANVHNKTKDSNLYNEGICQDCGGQLRYQESICDDNTVFHIFICSKCLRIYTIKNSNDIKFYQIVSQRKENKE